MSYGTEAALAAHVAHVLSCRVWAEVELPGVREIPDLVAIHPEMGLTIVETKLGASFDAVAQAAAWTDHAHTVLLAVPHRPALLMPNNREGDLLRRTCRAEKIGLWLMMGSGSGRSVAVSPIRNDNPRNIGFTDVLKRLPEYEPGTAVKHPGTPGRPERPELAAARACLVELVDAHGGQRVRAYWDRLAEKFSPRIADRIIDAAKRDKVPGIRAQRHGLWRLYSASVEEAAA